jgi:hypothetical protein
VAVDVSKPLSGRSLLQVQDCSIEEIGGGMCLKRSFTFASPNENVGTAVLGCLQTAKRSFTFARAIVFEPPYKTDVSKPLSGRSLLQA